MGDSFHQRINIASLGHVNFKEYTCISSVQIQVNLGYFRYMTDFNDLTHWSNIGVVE